jgi:hypothetical protein
VFKNCKNKLKKPLAYLSNASMECGIFPDRFNIAKGKPLYKKWG